MVNREKMSARAKRIKTERKRTAALQCAQAGLLIVPLHGKTKHGRCMCGAADCNQAGAHFPTPRGIANATKDTKAISRMWANWPKARICIALGGSAELVALVTDSAAARKALHKMTAPFGALPSTVTIQHQEKWIRLFRCAHRRISNVDITEGVRLLGDGEFVIAPSGSGGKRRYVDGRAIGEVELAHAPAWLFDIGTRLGSDFVNTSQTTVAPPPAPPSSAIVRASDVAPERIDWIWPNMIATRRVTSLVGRPGDGKSQVAIDIAATISTGRQWPGKAANSAASDVMILTAEDDPADTVVPRLIAAGANLNAVRVLKAVRALEGAERRFNLAADLKQLEKAGDLERVRLVIVDPASAYLALPTRRTVNRNRANEVRSVLDRCAGFAKRYDLGLLVVAHLNKSTGARALIRAPVEWTAVPHASHLVMREADSNRRLFLPLRNNLAPDRNGYAFEIQDRVIAGGIRTSAVVWRDDPVTICPNAALAPPARGLSSGAVKFVLEALRNGPRAAREMENRGRAAGFSPKQLRTGREKLGVKPEKASGQRGGWIWRLPNVAASLGPVVNADKNSASGEDAVPIDDVRSTSGGKDAPLGSDIATAAVQKLGSADLSDAAGSSDSDEGPAAQDAQYALGHLSHSHE